MPQVDEENEKVQTSAGPDVPVDLPPESFWLSKDAELDWLHSNAFMERNESTKGISQPATTQYTSSNPTSKRFPNLTSSKTSIFGLPKAQKVNTNKPAPTKFLPIPSFLAGKRSSSIAEPSSPKVSCMGRVGSIRKVPMRSSEPDKTQVMGRSKSFPEKKKSTFRFLSLFKSSKSKKKSAQKDVDNLKEGSTPVISKSSSVRVPDNVEPVSDPPGLGGMKRFVSGRRSTEEFGVY